MKSLAFSFLLVFLSGLAGAQPTVVTGRQSESIDSQRAQINAERSKLEAAYLTEDAACYKKFAVNNCLAQVNVRRREAMADLRRQEILLNDEERKIKGEDQIRKTEEKRSSEKQQEEADRRAKSVEDDQARLKREKDKQQARTTTRSNEKAAREANANRLLDHQKKIQARADKQAAAAEEAKKFNQRQVEARQRRAQHDADQLKRVKPPAKPLPLPPE
jgi:colicin import membrane protein